jgi:hypothetical protein
MSALIDPSRLRFLLGILRVEKIVLAFFPNHVVAYALLLLL